MTKEETQITLDFRNKQKEWKELLDKLEEAREKEE